MDQSLTSVMRNINNALRLDDDCHDKEAYMKYLDCIFCITCNLQQSVRAEGGKVVINKEVTKQVKLAQQCIERMAVLVDKIGSTQLPVVVTSPCDDTGGGTHSRLFVSVPPLPENLTNSFVRTKDVTPMELAYRQNQQLMSAYRARMARMNKRDPGAFNLSLTLQRKMAENLAIAKKTEMALAKKMQERQERLEEQAAKRFATPIGMSEEEQEQRQIYKRILDYEQDAKWLQNWRVKLKSSPEEPELICQLIQEILRCRDHPLTLMLKQYQYKVYEKIYPLVNSKREKLAAVAVPLARSLWPPELCDNAEGEQNQITSLAPVMLKGEGNTSSSCFPVDRESSQQNVSEHLEPSEGDTTAESEHAKNDLDTMSSVTSDLSSLSANSGGDDNQPGDSNKLSTSEPYKDEGNCQLDVTDDKDMQNDDRGEKNCDDVSRTSFEVVTDKDRSSKNNDSNEENLRTVLKENGISEVEPFNSNSCADAVVKMTEDVKEDLSKAMDKGAGLQKQLQTEQTKASRILRQVSCDYEKYNAENMDDLFDDDEDDGEEDVEPFSRHNARIEKNDNECDLPESDQLASLSGFSDRGGESLGSLRSGFSDHGGESLGSLRSGFSDRGGENLGSLRSDLSVVSRSSSGGSMQDFPSLPSLDCSSPEGVEIEQMSREAYQRHVKNISADVHAYMEKLLVLFTIAYEQLDSPIGRDQSYASLEEAFFKPLWKFLLMLFRLANYKDEVSLACKMTQKLDPSPKEMGVTEKLRLLPPSRPETSPPQCQPRPYDLAIMQLTSIKDHYTMLSKLECMVKVVQQVCDSVKEFYTSQGSRNAPSVGADDLLPVISYVVMQSRMPQLVSECHAMSEFIHEGYIMGQEGYCLTTLDTAVSYIISSDLNIPCSPT